MQDENLIRVHFNPSGKLAAVYDIGICTIQNDISALILKFQRDDSVLKSASLNQTNVVAGLSDGRFPYELTKVGL